jgi:hypothetical protein
VQGERFECIPEPKKRKPATPVEKPEEQEKRLHWEASFITHL